MGGRDQRAELHRAEIRKHNLQREMKGKRTMEIKNATSTPYQGLASEKRDRLSAFQEREDSQGEDTDSCESEVSVRSGIGVPSAIVGL